MQGFEQGLLSQRFFACDHGHQALVFSAVFALVFTVFVRHFARGFFAINGQPAGLGQHFAFGFKTVLARAAADSADARGDGVLRGRKKHRQKAARDQIVDFLFGFRQTAGRLVGGDDGKVVANFGIVKHAFAGADIALVQRRLRMRGNVAHRAVGQHLRGGFDGAQIVFGQVARIGTGVGQRLVALVQGLCQAERGFGAKAKFAIGLALQAGQVKQQGRCLGGGLGFFGHAGGLPAHGGGDGLGLCPIPQAVGFFVAVFGVFFPSRVKPFARIAARLGGKVGVDFKIVARNVFADLLLALDHHGQGGRLHAPDGGEEKAPIAAVKRRHGAGAIDAD